ncbi:hypothetical protein MKW98_010708 [Papaver atlanticum]|uniref:Uncharacterized protein n=1 Tax=Papaver atlanticum TaxID=357466 RepID=A0AAD4XDL6_9MAGN|nr:hypothetical protein MKW98_010708 [Papaver atlanticum]
MACCYNYFFRVRLPSFLSLLSLACDSNKQAIVTKIQLQQIAGPIFEELLAQGEDNTYPTTLEHPIKAHELSLEGVPALTFTGILIYVGSFLVGMDANPWVIKLELKLVEMLVFLIEGVGLQFNLDLSSLFLVHKNLVVVQGPSPLYGHAMDLVAQ